MVIFIHNHHRDVTTVSHLLIDRLFVVIDFTEEIELCARLSMRAQGLLGL